MLYDFLARQDQEYYPDVVSNVVRVINLDVYGFLDPGTTLSFVTPHIEVKFDVIPKRYQTLSQSLLLSMNQLSPKGI